MRRGKTAQVLDGDSIGPPGSSPLVPLESPRPVRRSKWWSPVGHSHHMMAEEAGDALPIFRGWLLPRMPLLSPELDEGRVDLAWRRQGLGALKLAPRLELGRTRAEKGTIPVKSKWTVASSEVQWRIPVGGGGETTARL